MTTPRKTSKKTRKTGKPEAPQRDIYQEVTDRICAELEAGAAPWVKPWKGRTVAPMLPYNAATKTPYSGVNILVLWGTVEAFGYPTYGFMTFNQAKQLGASVRKGEKGHGVVFTKRLRVRDEDGQGDSQGEDGEPGKIVSMLRRYTVFNVAQIDGLPDSYHQAPKAPEPAEGIAHAESFIAATRADIQHGGNVACYVPALDHIRLPFLADFKETAGYYATALHELGHWTAHPARMARDLSGRFGTRSYAAEELVAELTAAFLCAHLGIQGELRHAGYIKSWLELLRHDKRAIFTAASKASAAADYLRSFSESAEEQDNDQEAAAA